MTSIIPRRKSLSKESIPNFKTGFSKEETVERLEKDIEELKASVGSFHATAWTHLTGVMADARAEAYNATLRGREVTHRTSLLRGAILGGVVTFRGIYFPEVLVKWETGLESAEVSTSLVPVDWSWEECWKEIKEIEKEKGYA